LLENFPELAFSVSAATRKARGNEENGKDYYFLEKDDFEKKIKEGEFAEYEQVYSGTYYGTLKSEIERIWALGKTVIFDVDVKGGLNLKKLYGEKALAIFIKAPNRAVLEERLRNRDTENPQQLEERIQKAEEEMSYQNQFDVVVINDDLETAQSECRKLTSDFLGITRA